jgi:hypothetical protein
MSLADPPATEIMRPPEHAEGTVKQENSISRRDDQVGRGIRTVLALGILALSAALFTPFFSPLLRAAVLCYALYPFYNRLVLMTAGRHTISALIMYLFMTLGLIVPLGYLSLRIAEDTTDAYRAVVAWLKEPAGCPSESGKRTPCRPSSRRSSVSWSASPEPTCEQALPEIWRTSGDCWSAN